MIRTAALSMFAVVLSTGSGPEALRAQEAEPLQYSWGSERAQLHVIEFTDFGCGACRTFHAETYAQLFRDYVETGKVRWTFIPFVSGSFHGSDEAAGVAACAAPDAAGLPRVRSLIFQAQREWSRSIDPEAVLGEVLEQAGFDRAELAACLARDEHASALAAGVQAARSAGVRATPSFVVGGFMVPGALPLDLFAQFLDARLAQLGR